MFHSTKDPKWLLLKSALQIWGLNNYTNTDFFFLFYKYFTLKWFDFNKCVYSEIWRVSKMVTLFSRQIYICPLSKKGDHRCLTSLPKVQALSILAVQKGANTCIQETVKSHWIDSYSYTNATWAAPFVTIWPLALGQM